MRIDTRVTRRAWEELGNPYGVLGRAVLRQMALASRTVAGRSPANDGDIALDARVTAAINAWRIDS